MNVYMTQRPPPQQHAQPTSHRWALYLCLLALCSASVHGATVYRSVDDNGVVTFSDTPPGSSATVETLQLEVPAANPDDLQQDRLEQMRATTDRMAADRMAREKHRAELRKLDRESRPSEVVSREPQYDITLPYYYPSRWRHPGLGAVHPGPHPPLRPTPRSSSNDYPASLIRRGYQPRVREAFAD